MIEFEFYKKVYKDYHPTTISANDKCPNSKDIIRFFGVLDCRKNELAVPIKYTHLTLYDGDTDFNAVVGEEYTNEYGIRSIQYGLIYNGKMVLPCINKEIQVLSRNIFIIKEQNRFSLVSKGKKLGSYSSISSSAILGRKEIVIEESDNYKSSKICNYIYYCAILHEGNKKGLYSPDKDILIEPQFNEINPIIEQGFILADNRLYKIANKAIIMVKDMNNYTYIGGIENCHLFLVKGEDKTNRDNYIYLWLNNGDYKECYDIEYVEDCIKKYYLRDISKWKYYPILYVGGYYYSVKENIFKKDISDFMDNSGMSSPDNWNYERDTYYALGGSDYERWKEDGGDLDSMMDSMGY